MHRHASPLSLMVNQNELPHLLSATLLVVALKVKSPIDSFFKSHHGIVYVCFSLIFVCLRVLESFVDILIALWHRT